MDKLENRYCFTLADNVAAYAQYSDAKDPINANIFPREVGEDLDLTDAEQWEIGIKAMLPAAGLEATIAYFDIQRDDVLEQIGVDSASNVGGPRVKWLGNYGHLGCF